MSKTKKSSRSDHEIAETQFDREWKRQEKQSKVDGFGGAEYRRVKREWISAGRPTKAIEAFIRHGVSLPPCSH